MIKNLESNIKNNKVVYISGLLLFISAIFSVGYYHADEHFQLLEFAGYKLGLTEEKFLTWEYHERIRPTFQPFIVILIYKLFSLFSINNPFFVAFVLRILSAILSLFTLNLIYKHFSKSLTNIVFLNWFKIIVFLSWFIIFFGVRFSSENWSGSLFIIGLIYFLQFKNQDIGKYFIIGVLFGLSFLFRFQILFMVAGFYAWLLFISKDKIKNLVSISAGIIVIVGVGIILDSWFYGKFTISAYNYFTQNLIVKRAESYGIEPWYYYFKSAFEKGIPPLSIIYVLSILYFVVYKPKDLLTWCIVPFLVIHFFIGHKELRFFFPILFLIPVFVIHFLKFIVEKRNINFDQSNGFTVFMKIFFIINFIFSIIVAFRPMMTKIHLFDKIYSDYPLKTKVYYLDKTPFEEIHFYRRPNLEIIQIANFDEVKEQKKLDNYNHLVITNPDNTVPHFIKKSKLVYSTFPKWLYVFNVGNWMSKSESYSVYEIND